VSRKPWGVRMCGAIAAQEHPAPMQAAWSGSWRLSTASLLRAVTELLASLNLSNYAVDRFGPRYRDFADGRHWPLSTRMRDERIRESWRSRRRVYRDIAGHEVLTARWRLIRTGNPA
jgi:hypothetical protein